RHRVSGRLPRRGGAVPRRPRCGGRPRVAHRVGRPLLLVPDRRAGTLNDDRQTPTEDRARSAERIGLRFQASSRSTTSRRAGTSDGAGTSETLGTNEAACDVAATCSWSFSERIPSLPSVASSSRMYVLSISGPSVLIVKRISLRRNVSKIQRNSSQPETT